MFSFLPEAKRDFMCMKCKLVAVLEEKILRLEGQVKMIVRIRETDESLDSQI